MKMVRENEPQSSTEKRADLLTFVHRPGRAGPAVGVGRSQDNRRTYQILGRHAPGVWDPGHAHPVDGIGARRCG